MLFMVIEQFKNGDARAVYKRLEERGRMMPDGLTYVDSWIDAGLGRCFQLMEADDAGLFQAWIANWSDLMDFEVVPVTRSKEAAAAVKGA